ncbi:Monooxygenase FAD-binding protein [Cladophialophora carrionii]|uniref:Monooxygenase FAD-binding protein n=1 Tax=Cladophialophora carrionii TaxID=86049 RepID=A0A1C1CWA1_9EURO|nr:Monooxygenase FAD-binding protein [Cladophialophora carrionii]
MAYRFANDKLLNLVVTHPAHGEPETWNGIDHVAALRRDFKGWDPALTTLLDMVQTAAKSPLKDIRVPEKWSSPSRKTILVGDAAHAMLSFMASGRPSLLIIDMQLTLRLGAAMAVEDAVALAESLRFATRKDMVSQAVAVFEQVRIPRVKQVHDATVKHGYTLHLPDGPEQQSRDKAMEKEVNGEHFISSPNQWSDPTVLSWLYPHKPAVAVRKAWAERGPKNHNGVNGFGNGQKREAAAEGMCDYQLEPSSNPPCLSIRPDSVELRAGGSVYNAAQAVN